MIQLIQPILLLVAMVALVTIFVRRYKISEKGLSSAQASDRSKNRIYHFLMRNQNDNFEITVEEMIPAAETINLKNKLKAESIFRKADAAMEKGDLKTAERILIQSLALDPSNQEAYSKLGLIYLKEGMFSKAELIYRKLLLGAMEDPSYLSNLGLALYQQQKLEEAKSYYQKALQFDQSRPGRFFSLGQILHELENFEEALQHFSRASEMDPKNIDYLLTLASFYIDRSMPVEAKQMLDRVLAIDPNNQMAHEMLKEKLVKKDPANQDLTPDSGGVSTSQKPVSDESHKG